MQVAPLERQIRAADLPPEQLAGNTHLTEQEKITEVSRQFEALLLRQILQNAQKTVIQSDLTEESTATSIYRDLITSQLAESISKSGSFGLAKTLESQMSQQLIRRPESPETGTAHSASLRKSAATPAAVVFPLHHPLHSAARPHE